jgi:hypothetical protein
MLDMLIYQDSQSDMRCASMCLDWCHEQLRNIRYRAVHYHELKLDYIFEVGYTTDQTFHDIYQLPIFIPYLVASEYLQDKLARDYQTSIQLGIDRCLIALNYNDLGDVDEELV